MKKKQIKIFDTTLRDGEQAAGCRMGIDEKLKVARQLVKLNVDIIEAGFPASSPVDFEAVEVISREVKGPIICGLTRAVKKDIDACGQALAKAERSRIHTGIGVSDIHVMGKFRDGKYGKTLEEKRENIRKMSVEAVKQAKDYTNDVEFYAEDAGRADKGYLFSVIEAVIAAGATVVNIPDTTGFTIPEEFGQLIGEIRKKVPNIDQATISVHCHNDLGMATANSLAAVKNGAGQVEGTINGIGERAGNAALEEIVMAIQTRQDYFKNIDCGIKTDEFYKASRMVADILGMPVPPNKAIIGGNAFAHSSGIHVDGFLKERLTYEIFKAEDVGFPESRVILTARTGRHGVRHRLEEMGYTFTPEEMEQVYARFLAVADKKQEVFDEDLVAIVHDEIHESEETVKIKYIRAICGTGTVPKANIKVSVDDEVKQASSHGDGPVDAVYKAIGKVVDMDFELVKYNIRAATGGTNAMGEVTVCLVANNKKVIGKGASTDIIEASAKAYVDGINKLAIPLSQ